MNIVFLEEDTVVLDGDIDLEPVKSFGEYRGYGLSPQDDPLPYCRDADVVIVNKMKMTRERLDSLPGLRLICVAATGYDNVDVRAAGEKGIGVANVAGYATTAVAQNVFAMILNLCTRMMDYARDVAAGEWHASDVFCLLRYPSYELEGLMLGIIGFGAIGHAVARIGEAFGMRTLPYDRGNLSEEGYPNRALDQVLREADVLSLHCPLTEKTRGLIDAGALSKMKPTALLINTARGGIVDERALADALNRGVIAGAGVDTLSVEPPAGGNPLLDGVKNLIVTPHTAWTTRDARQRLMNAVAGNIAAFAEGRFEGFVV